MISCDSLRPLLVAELAMLKNMSLGLSTWIQCGLCGLEMGLERVGEHIERLHLGNGGECWGCGECEFSGGSLNDIAAHCLLLGHNSHQVRPGDPRQAQKTKLNILTAIQERFDRSALSAFSKSPKGKEAEKLNLSEEEALEDIPCSPSEVEASFQMGNVKEEKSEQEMGSEPDDKRLECQRCQTTVGVWKTGDRKILGNINIGSLRNHIVRYHLNGGKLYACSACPYQNSVKEKMTVHSRRVKLHDSKPTTTLKINDELRPQVVTLLTECFPILQDKFNSDAAIHRFINSF